MATNNTAQKSLIDVYNERPDVQAMIKTKQGDPFAAGTEANTSLNDWWNANGSKEYADVSLAQPNQITSIPKVNVPTEIPSSLLTGMKTTESDIQDLITNRQNLLKQYQTLPSESAETTSLKNEIAGVQKQIGNTELAEQMGLQAEADRVIPLEFITGRQQSIANQAAIKLNALNNTYQNLTTRLGLSQESDKLKKQGIQDLLSYTTEDLDIQFKLQDKLQASIDSIQKRIDSYSDEAKQEINTIIEMYSQIGMDFNDLSADDKAYLVELSRNSGTPLGVYQQALATAKNKYLLDEANKTREEAMDLQLKQLDIEKAQADIAYTRKYTANIGKSSGSSFESPVEGISSQKQLTLFNSMIENGKGDLQRGISWGNVWNDIKKSFPSVPDQVIDAQLGSYWKQNGAFEAYKGTQNINSASYDALDAAIADAMK